MVGKWIFLGILISIGGVQCAVAENELIGENRASLDAFHDAQKCFDQDPGEDLSRHHTTNKDITRQHTILEIIKNLTTNGITPHPTFSDIPQDNHPTYSDISQDNHPTNNDESLYNYTTSVVMPRTYHTKDIRSRKGTNAIRYHKGVLSPEGPNSTVSVAHPVEDGPVLSPEGPNSTVSVAHPVEDGPVLSPEGPNSTVSVAHPVEDGPVLSPEGPNSTVSVAHPMDDEPVLSPEGPHSAVSWKDVKQRRRVRVEAKHEIQKPETPGAVTKHQGISDIDEHFRQGLRMRQLTELSPRVQLSDFCTDPVLLSKALMSLIMGVVGGVLIRRWYNSPRGFSRRQRRRRARSLTFTQFCRELAKELVIAILGYDAFVEVNFTFSGKEFRRFTYPKLRQLKHHLVSTWNNSRMIAEACHNTMEDTLTEYYSKARHKASELWQEALAYLE
ncbi:uncharacterized protein LOC116601244 [Nematostella vectensis]|uniref:uncharacterized protein LOC116601244 n=1 Tax=Nematostella vectensis TaxID=45351 RepID=UPI002077955A|nr:uncharacterized protein LOC116601244 [Nematostella vectensis]